jgi:hypothetical protein
MTSPTITINYAPQAYQAEWHECDTVFQAIVAGRQIGKTYAIVNEIIKRALSFDRSQGGFDESAGVARFWYVTNDYKQAKRNVWDLFLQLSPKEARPKINNSELKIDFPNGARIELIGVENVESLRGAKVFFAVLDEYDDFPTHVYPTIIEPMFNTTGGQRWFVGSPKGFKNLYQLYQTQDPLYTVHKVPSCTLSQDLRTVVAVTSEYAKIEALQQALDRAWRENDFSTFAQEHLADFNKPKGAVYQAWPLEHYAPLEYDELLPLHVTIDWGVNDPTAMLWIQPGKEEIRVIDYAEFRDGSIEMISQILRSKPYKWPDLITGDPAGNARTMTTGTSPIEMLEQKGIYVTTKYGVTIPEQIRVAKSIINRLWVNSNKAERFRDILVNYSYPEISENVRNQSNEVPIHDEWSHGARAFEYWAVNYQDYLPVKTVHRRVSYDSVTGRRLT